MDLASIVASYENAEAQLVAARESILALQTRLAPYGRTLPPELVAEYNRQRSQVAQRVVYLVTRLQENFRAVPFVGEGIANRLGNVNDWRDAFLSRVLPLRLLPGTGNFGAIPAAAWSLAQLLVIVGGVAAALYLSRDLLRSLNDQAVASEAEATRLAAYARGQVQLAETLAAAGATPEQIIDGLRATRPPDAPEAWGIGKILTIVGSLAAAAGAVYWFTNRPRRRRA